MIIVVIIISLIYVILLTLILIAYYRDNSDLERRVLELEKRLSNKVYKDLSKEELNELRERWENDYFHWINVPEYMTIENVGDKIGIKVNKEIENNTQRECECDMACGRKKGRGGKRK